MAITEPLTSLTTLKAELGITTTDSDTQLQRIIRAISAMVEGYCGRILSYAASTTEKIGSNGNAQLVVKRFPIIDVDSIVLKSSVTDAGTTIDPDTYDAVSDADSGIINFPNMTTNTGIAQFWLTPIPRAGTLQNFYEVTFEGGWVTPDQAVALSKTRTLPYDLEDAVIQACRDRYLRTNRDSSIRSEALMSASVSYNDKAENLSVEVRSILDQYRVIGLGL